MLRHESDTLHNRLPRGAVRTDGRSEPRRYTLHHGRSRLAGGSYLHCYGVELQGSVSPEEKEKPTLNGNSASGKKNSLQGYYSLKKGICQVAKQEYKRMAAEKKQGDRQEYLQEVLK